MGIFDLFKAKPSKTLIVFDHTSLSSLIENSDLIKKYNDPVVFLYYADNQKEKLSQIKININNFQTVQLPTDLKFAATFLLGAVLTEFYNSGQYQKVVFVTSQSPLQYTVYQLGTKAPFEVVAYSKENSINPKTKEFPEKVRREKKEAPVKIVKEKTIKEQVIEPKVQIFERDIDLEFDSQSIDIKDIEVICNAFKTKFVVDQSYSKSILGSIVKQTSGKTLVEIFKTNNAKIFVNALLKSGCIELIDAQNWVLLKYPVATELEFEDETNQDSKGPRKRKKKSKAKTEFEEAE